MGFREKTHKLFVQGISAQQIWKVWTDINNWHIWDLDIEWARIEGRFENGNIFYLKPKGGLKVKITLQNIVHEKTFTDLARFPLAKMYSIHTMTPISGGFELTHTVRIEGLLSFLWWHLVGKNVAAGMEEQSKKLVEIAREIRE